MRDAVGKLAVVRDQDQSFARTIEPADGEDPLLGRHEIDHPRPPLGIEVGGDDADGLVDRVVERLRLPQRFPIDADLVPQRIDLRAELRHDLSIDLDAPVTDELLAIPPAADTRRSEHLLQSLGPALFGPAISAIGRFGAVVPAAMRTALVLAGHGETCFCAAGKWC